MFWGRHKTFPFAHAESVVNHEDGVALARSTIGPAVKNLEEVNEDRTTNEPNALVTVNPVLVGSANHDS